MRVRINNKQPTAAQRKMLRQECVKEFETLLDTFNRDVMIQLIYLFHFKYGYGQKRLEQLTNDLKEALQSIHIHYELSENDTPWLCEKKLKEDGIDIDALIKEG